MKTVEGILNGKGFKFAIVLSRFNDFFSGKLLDGARDCLLRHGVNENDILLVKVPGTFEMPSIAMSLSAKKDIDAIICLGVLLRGDTPHFDLLSQEVTKGIARVSMESKKPVTFGIITADTMEQAVERAGSKDGNKGFQSALSAIEMVNLRRVL